MANSILSDNVQEFSKWEEQYVYSVKRINEFRVAHFEKSLTRLQEMLRLLQVDCGKFTTDERKMIGKIARRRNN